MFRVSILLGLLTILTQAQIISLKESTSASLLSDLVPAFYNGYLYSRTPANVLTLFAPDGRQMLTLPLKGGSNISVLSAAVDSDTTVAVAWSDEHKAGIEIRDWLGNQIRSIDAGTFVPAHISFGEDHTIWSLGWQRDAAGGEEKDYPLVRRYAQEGGEIGAYLPRSLFPPGLCPACEWQRRQITVTGDRVGIQLVLGRADNQYQMEWVELDLNGRLTGRWKLDPDNLFPGVVLTSDNQAYVHRSAQSINPWAFSLWRLNRAAAAWERVNAPEGHLYGADGDKLVFAHWDYQVHLSWFRQPEK
jgi:hypothetical protein